MTRARHLTKEIRSHFLSCEFESGDEESLSALEGHADLGVVGMFGDL